MTLTEKLARTEGRRLDVIGVGECMVELFADEPLGQARQLRRSYGGDVLNTLMTASRLGCNASFVSKVGNDPFGPSLKRAWEREGIDLSHCPLVEGENGVYFISLLDGGEREFTYRRAGSAASRLSPADIDAGHMASSRIVALSGITQAISPTAQAATLEAARLGAEAGCMVALDVNYRAALWQKRGGEEAAARALEELLPYLDVLIASLPADAPPLAGSSPEDAARQALSGTGPSAVIFKLGPDGVRIQTAEESLAVPAAPVNEVVDTTGAGDAWNAGFFSKLLQGSEPARAAHEANVTAAGALGHRGAIGPRIRSSR